MKNLFLLAGLPRSGSTLIGSILSQNPDIFLATQSPFIELLWRQYSLWGDKGWEIETSRLEKNKVPYLRSTVDSYFDLMTDKDHVIDCRRHWHLVPNIKMYQEVFGISPKILCPVRNVEEIMASYKNVFSANKTPWNPETMDSQMFKLPYLSFKDAYNSKYRNCLLLVEYNKFVKSPMKVLEDIYKFLEIPSFEHDLKTIVADEFYEDVDDYYNLKGLHKISGAIVSSNTNAKTSLTIDQYGKFKELSFWNRGAIAHCL
jgi:sulfotransferase